MICTTVFIPKCTPPLPVYDEASQCSSHKVVKTTLVPPREKVVVKVENTSVAIVNKKRWEETLMNTLFSKRHWQVWPGSADVDCISPSAFWQGRQNPYPGCSLLCICTCGKYFTCDMQFKFQFQSHMSHATNVHEGVCMLISLLSGMYKLCTHSMYSSK